VAFSFGGTLAEFPVDWSKMWAQAAAIAAAFDQELSSSAPLWIALDKVRERIAAHDRQQGLEFHTRARFALLETELKGATQGRVFAFVPRLFAELLRRQFSPGVLTLASLPAIKAVAPDFQDWGALWCTRDDSRLPKPDPAAYQGLFRCLGLRPEAVLYLGDHPLDVQVARRLGCQTAGVPPVEDNQADLILPQADVILDWLA
jgi:phosphoglycolate phosphatase